MEGAQIASPLATASIQYVINVALTLPAIIFLDKWGRRPALILGSFGMMTWLFISGKPHHHCLPPPQPLKIVLYQVRCSNTTASRTPTRRATRPTPTSPGSCSTTALSRPPSFRAPTSSSPPSPRPGVLFHGHTRLRSSLARFEPRLCRCRRRPTGKSESRLPSLGSGGPVTPETSFLPTTCHRGRPRLNN